MFIYLSVLGRNTKSCKQAGRFAETDMKNATGLVIE